MKASSEELQLFKSPDKLNESIRLVKPGHLIFILSITGIFIAAIIWSIVTKVPVYVQGKGILINESGISEVKTQFPGKVSTLQVKIGQHVEQGDVLAAIEQLDLTFDIKKLGTQIREIRKSLDWLMENTDPAARNAAIRQLRTDISNDEKKLKELDPASETYAMESSELEKKIQADKLRLFDLVNFREERVFEFRNTLLTYESDLQFKKNQLVRPGELQGRAGVRVQEYAADL
jgi:HlyD family secretion protein